MLFHHVFEQTHWENLYYLLCAFSFYFSTNSIFFENTITSSIDAYWENFYYLLCAFSFYFLTSSIFFENMIINSIRSYWENLYYLLCAFSFYSSIFFENTHELNLLLLGKSLSFTMCFLILFLDERTEKISIIYYVLSHRVHSISRQAHCHWENIYYLLYASSFYSSTSSIFFENTITNSTRSYWGNLYHLLCASSSSSFYFSMSALSLKKSLLFNECFLIELSYWGNLYYLLCAFSFYSSASVLKTSLLFTMCFFDERIVIEKLSIILYVLSHRVLRRAHCHWKNLYYLVSAFSVIDVRDLTSTLIMIDVKSFLETLGKSLLFSRCFPIIFLDERIEER